MKNRDINLLKPLLPNQTNIANYVLHERELFQPTRVL